MVFLCFLFLVILLLFIEELFECSIVLLELVFILLLLMLFGVIFLWVLGVIWFVLVVVFVWLLLVCVSLSVVSAVSLVRFRVVVRNNVVSFVIFIGCFCYGCYVG